MNIKERYAKVLDWFREKQPLASTELDYSNDPFRLLVAVMLSAQCTDKRVNSVTPALFQAFPTPERLACASFEEVFPLVKSISYPNSKTRHLIQMAGMLVRDYAGSVPADTNELVKLPGVGIKTANVIASIVYDKPVIAVDTHVFRVARRLGLSEGKTVLAVEKDLETHIPVNDRGAAHHWLLLHGRYVCTSRTPKCDECGLAEICPAAPADTSH